MFREFDLMGIMASEGNNYINDPSYSAWEAFTNGVTSKGIK